MPDFDSSLSRRKRAGRSKLTRIPLAALGVLALGAAGLAIAAGSRPTLHSAHNAQLGRTIVVDSEGRTVYALRPETNHHLMCTAKACFKFWPPVTVRSKRAKLKAGPGVKGRLGVLRRSKGVLQVTIGGLPLYRFALDHGIKGNAGGQGIQSFGGTWHVITAKGSKASKTGPATTPTTSTMPTTQTTPTYPAAGY